MRRNILFVLSIVVLALCPLKCNATEQKDTLMFEESAIELEKGFIKEGYTEEGIYYKVYGENVVSRSSEYITVNRTIVYEGEVRPASTIYWEEQINGEMYTGTLLLLKYSISSGKTTAVYTGKLYKQ